MGERLKEFGRELLDGIRQSQQDRLDDATYDAANEEYIEGIRRATAAMVELGIKDERITSMLIKHWNLRPSEATEFLEERKAINTYNAKKAAEQKKVNAPRKKPNANTKKQ